MKRKISLIPTKKMLLPLISIGYKKLQVPHEFEHPQRHQLNYLSRNGGVATHCSEENRRHSFLNGGIFHFEGA